MNQAHLIDTFLSGCSEPTPQPHPNNKDTFPALQQHIITTCEAQGCDENTLYSHLSTHLNIPLYPHTPVEFHATKTLPLWLQPHLYQEVIAIQTNQQLTLITPHPKFANSIKNKLTPHKQITLQLVTAQRFHRIREEARHYRVFFASPESDNYTVHIVNHVLQHAIERNASDIHIEPQSSALRIRYRIDGLLVLVVTLPLSATPHILSRLKIMATLDISEHRQPQDGRFQFHYFKQEIDCRINFTNTLLGEKAVIRILDTRKAQLTLTTLFPNADKREHVYQAIQRPQGLTLITGPTGSGKTQTLYSLLSTINKPEKNISTIEDPVEIQLPGISQTQIQPNIDLTFPRILKSLLRQDPDIIMLGEIRDPETAEIAIRAAQTGHAVLATLHTNNAAASIQRLINLGIAPYNLLNTINLIIAQRLVRRLCPHCKKPITTAQRQQLPGALQPKESNTALYGRSTCERCTDGYAGRIAVTDLLHDTSLLNQHISAISQQSPPPVPTHSLRTEAIQLFHHGIICFHEIQRVIDV